MGKVILGRLELDIIQDSSGENVYTLELFNQENMLLYKQLEEFIDKNVKITIEKLD